MKFPSDFHPTPKGVRWMARKLAPKIAEIRDESAAWTPGSDPLTAAFERDCLNASPQEAP